MPSDKADIFKMEHISPTALQELTPRLTYTISFLNFTPEDGAAIHASRPLISPLIQTVLDAIYTKLLGYDITAKAFVPKTVADLDNDPSPSVPEDLYLEHAHIKRQMTFLKGYLLKIVQNEDWSPSSPLWEYMDKVAIAHTGLPGFQHRAKRPELRVEYMHLGLLLGWVQDVVLGAVMGMDTIDLETKSKVTRAWGKLLWLQNDLFARKYVLDRDTGETPVGIDSKAPAGASQMLAVAVVAALSGAIMASAWHM